MNSEHASAPNPLSPQPLTITHLTLISLPPTLYPSASRRMRDSPLFVRVEGDESLICRSHTAVTLPELVHAGMWNLFPWMDACASVSPLPSLPLSHSQACVRPLCKSDSVTTANGEGITGQSRRTHIHTPSTTSPRFNALFLLEIGRRRPLTCRHSSPTTIPP